MDESPLLGTAGFGRIRIWDESTSYRETAAAWLREWERNAEHLEPLFGSGEFADAQRRRRETLTAIDRGLLKRYLITAHTTR